MPSQDDVPVPGKAQLWKTADGRYRARQPWRGGRQETFRTQREALDWQAAELTKRRQGRSTEREAAADPTMTIAKVHHAYFDLREDWEVQTRNLHRIHWQRLAKAVGSLHPDDVTTHHVLALRTKMLTGKGRLSATYARDHLMYLSALLDHATDRGWRTRPGNPVTAARRQAKTAKEPAVSGEGRERALPAAVAQQYLDALPERYWLAGFLAYQCGLRSGEVRGLTIDCIDFFRGTIHVRQSLKVAPAAHRWEDDQEHWGRLYLGSPKTDRPRTLKVPQDVIEAISAHLVRFPSDRFVLTTRRGGPMTPASLESGWNTARKTVGGSARIHDLRHSYCTDLLDAGVPVATVAKLAGHSSPVVTQRVYAHSTEVGEAAALAAMKARAASSAEMTRVSVASASHLDASSAAD